ncbi:ATP-dependent helicase [Stutzerimonas xanthomarina]|jgi:superfamily I DNA/RNA helicase|nr:ATP-dependent helicase [Stutzerimonas xanthomarina]|tara:strand:- start:194 stop:1864 length:1671 start_codon:yes stop_codon:yes gene_type:complete
MISNDQWAPSPGVHLDRIARSAVNELGQSILLTAGPGAGKTEVLAQRADYLLRTNNCRYPKRILAVSFKTDASRNLKERIQLRCGWDYASRFDSVTFHGLAKRIIDKFRPILDEENLSPDYTIGADPIPGKQITFKQLLPLAIKIIQRSEIARNAIRKTYAHVFLDEFQDCTRDQYELIKLIFLNTDIRLTAVGDSKQMIMAWAGALEGIFKIYADDFGALPLHLYVNFRSQPNLRRVQNEIIWEIDPTAVTPAEMITGQDGEVLAANFQHSTQEAEVVADSILHWIKSGVSPSEIAVLVPRQVDDYCSELMSELGNRGVASRNDSDLQDLLKEPAVRLVIDYLTCLYGTGESEAWSRLMDLFAPYDEASRDQLHMLFELTYRSQLRRVKAASKTDSPYDDWWTHTSEFLNGMGYPMLTALSGDYESTPRLHEVVRDIRDRIRALLLSEGTIARALARLSNDQAVRFLTIHKSKGLEFNTVILLGVEKQAFWAKIKDERCVFFVGVSRAKERLLITTADYRPKPKGAAGQWKENRTPHGEFVTHVTRHLTGNLLAR